MGQGSEARVRFSKAWFEHLVVLHFYQTDLLPTDSKTICNKDEIEVGNPFALFQITFRTKREPFSFEVF